MTQPGVSVYTQGEVDALVSALRSEIAARPAPTPTPVSVDAAVVAAADLWAPTVTSVTSKAGQLKAALEAWKQSHGYT